MDVLVIRCKDILNSEYIYATLSRGDFFTYDVAGAKGTKMPRGEKAHIMAYPILENKNLIMKYSSAVRSLCKKIYKARMKNRHLSSLHDWLLPMLMNGQVKFK